MNAAQQPIDTRRNAKCIEVSKRISRDIDRDVIRGRKIGVKMLEISRDHWLGDQTALEALVRFTGEELKHQALFRAIERLVGEGMPDGYEFLPQPNDVASFVLSKSTWAVLALTCHIELFTQAHYRQSIEPDENLSELYKDVFFFH